MKDQKIRSMTGIKPTSNLHLGNYAGAIAPIVADSKDPSKQVVFLCVDYHALTDRKNIQVGGEQSLPLLATLLASGFELEGNMLLVQSHIPEILQNAWFLSCATSVGLLERAHAYKDAVSNGKDATVGLFSYPVLMASDILSFDSDEVPVGQDQAQHLEFTNDMAGYFNSVSGESVFKQVRPRIQETPLVIGTDGERKMSKSYGNHIPLFERPKVIEKAIKRITTDAKGLDEPKDPETCTIFKILESFGSEERIADMKSKLLKGTGYGYGHAKADLWEAHQETFGTLQPIYDHYLENPKELFALLEPSFHQGHQLARSVSERARLALRLISSKVF